jgi:hypothetical protein
MHVGVGNFHWLFSVSGNAVSYRKRMNSNPGPYVSRDCNQSHSDFVFIWKQNLFKASFKLIEFVLFLLEPNNTSAGEALIEFASIATTRRCVMLLMRMSSGLLACNNYD